jgi:hypothetical protein
LAVLQDKCDRCRRQARNLAQRGRPLPNPVSP